MTTRLLLVEDSYGVDFHKVLVHKILQSPRLRIARLPARECNPAMVRRAKAMLIKSGASRAKLVIVVDSEGMNPGAVRSRVYMHFEKDPVLAREQVRVVVVEPRHEAWLCIGLGLDRAVCRARPEDALVRSRGARVYEKRFLAQWAHQVDVERLRKEEDFQRYVEALTWLSRDP